MASLDIEDFIHIDAEGVCHVDMDKVRPYVKGDWYDDEVYRAVSNEVIAAIQAAHPGINRFRMHCVKRKNNPPNAPGWREPTVIIS